MNVFHSAHLPREPAAVVPPLAMADLLPVIETNEHRWMRAWVGRDSKALRSLTARNFVMLIGLTARTASCARRALVSTS